MGLHNLDGSFDYTIQNVNNNPIILYGTFEGEIVFLEASLTLFASKMQSFQIPQSDGRYYSLSLIHMNGGPML